MVPIDPTPQLERLAEAELTAAASRRSDLNPATVVLHGEPVSQSPEYADRLGYEVLMVGARGEDKTRSQIGSVASAIARGTTLPVLLVDDHRRDQDA